MEFESESGLGKYSLGFQFWIIRSQGYEITTLHGQAFFTIVIEQMTENRCLILRIEPNPQTPSRSFL